MERTPYRRRKSHRAGRTLRLAFLAGLCLLAAHPPAANAADHGVRPDRVIAGAVPASRGPTATASSAGAYPVAGGGSVRVDVDAAYAATDAVARVLEMLGATPHGAEISTLTVHIAEPGNLFRLCGQNATACYLPASRIMVVSGSPINPNNAMPQAMVIAHEYGHHLEASRSFSGWNASDLGARHWATYEHVCEGVADGRLYPGDQGLHYWENPGEAFAQAYATMLYPDAVPWWWSFAEPDQGAFDAIRADIADGSRGTAVSWKQRLSPGRPSATTPISTALDGPVDVTVRQPRGARFAVQLLSADGSVLARAHPARRVKSNGRKSKARRNAVELNYDSCSTHSFQLQVIRRAGKGRFAAQIVRP